MTNLTIRTAQAPAPITVSLDLVIRKFSSRIEERGFQDYAIPADSAPSDAERASLSRRQVELSASLAPIGRQADDVTVKEIKALIGSLKAVFPARNEDEASAKTIMALYAVAVAAFPLWAIREACHRFLDGRAGKGNFAPTPPELAAECQNVVVALHQERASVERILAAKPYTEVPEDERARVLAGLEKLSREITDRADIDRPDRERRASERRFRTDEERRQIAEGELARLQDEAASFKPAISPQLQAMFAAEVAERETSDRLRTEREAKRGRAVA